MKTLITALFALIVLSCEKEQPKEIFESVTITDRGAPDPDSLPERFKIDGMMYYPNTINGRPTGPVLIMKNKRWEIYKKDSL